jgi:hypothetical protein
METYVECICGKKFHVDRSQVEEFDCEGCGRHIVVPTPPLDARLKQLRELQQKGAPGVTESARKAAEMRNFHAVPILKQCAQSGVRDAVNVALVGLVDYPPGRDVVTEWIRGKSLSVTRLTGAMTEEKYSSGVDYVCALITKGYLGESQVAEVAPWLGKSESQRALDTLREARRKYPNLGGILDSAMVGLRNLDESAGGIPDEAKRIPGRSTDAEEPEQQKKGCLGLVLVIVLALGMLASVIAVMT